MHSNQAGHAFCLRRHIYKYINIYTRNLKFAQLVTELASLAINIYTRNLKFAQLVTELASLAINYNMIGDISNDLFFSQCYVTKKFPSNHGYE